MAKNDVPSWDTTAGNNTDIAGINIAEFCPPSSINDAIRTVMAQIASWIVSATGPLLRVAANTIANATLILDGAGAARAIGYRTVPSRSVSTATVPALTDVGQAIKNSSGGWTIPANATVAFAVDDVITLYNNSSSAQTITQASGVTLRLVATSTTGNRTLAQRGVATCWQVAANEWVVSGAGVS